MICDQIRQCHLTDLSLKANFIQGKGAIDISKALAECRQLKSLDLSKNRIGVEGCKYLINEGVFSGYLMKADMKQNMLDEMTKQMLRDAVKDKPNFEMLL